LRSVHRCAGRNKPTARNQVLAYAENPAAGSKAAPAERQQEPSRTKSGEWCCAGRQAEAEPQAGRRRCSETQCPEVI